MVPSSPKDNDEKVKADGEQKPEAKESRKRKKSDISDSGDDSQQDGGANEKKGKNWKRIMANRKSARESRIRRIKYMETLETSVEELTRENTALLRENQMLARDNFALRQQLGGMGAGMMDGSTSGDADAYRQAHLARAGASGEGAAGLSSMMSPNRPSMASRTALARSALDMPHPMMEHTGFRPQDDRLNTLAMIRRRQEQNTIPSLPPPAPPTEEEQRLLNIMRKGREQSS